MNYFKRVKNFEDLKKQYRELAVKHHPDKGGKLEEMQAVNNEYDQLFPIWKRTEEYTTGINIDETAHGSRLEFYTVNGWRGNNFNGTLDIKEIAKRIRLYLKEVWSECRFSVKIDRFSYGCAIKAYVLETPWKACKSYDEFTRKEKNDFSILTESYKMQGWSDELIEQVRDEYIKSDELVKVIDDVNREISSYRFVDSDGRIDYHDTNFYFNGIEVGRYDKEYKVVGRKQKVKKSIV